MGRATLRFRGPRVEGEVMASRKLLLLPLALTVMLSASSWYGGQTFTWTGNSDGTSSTDDSSWR